ARAPSVGHPPSCQGYRPRSVVAARTVDSGARIVLQPSHVLGIGPAGGGAAHLVLGAPDLGHDHPGRAPHPAVGRVNSRSDESQDDQLWHHSPPGGPPQSAQPSLRILEAISEAEARPKGTGFDSRKRIIGQRRPKGNSLVRDGPETG